MKSTKDSVQIISIPQHSVFSEQSLSQEKDTLSEHSSSLSVGNKTESLFSNHLLESKDVLLPKLHIKDYQYWISGILLAAFIIYVWLKVAYKKQLEKMFVLFFTNRAGSRTTKEEYTSSKRYSVFLSLLFVMILSLFIYQLLFYYSYFTVFRSNEIVFYLSICAFVLLAYSVKLITVRGLGFIFNIRNETSEYIFNIFLFGKILGLFLFPLVLCVAFLKLIPVYYIFPAGYFLIGFFFVYRTFRIIEISFHNNSISKHYLFLYLCGLEILPLIVLIKTFINIT